MPKLIVIRGNSGSGKTSIARRIRDLAHAKVAYVEQDYVRRTVLREKEVDHRVTFALIDAMVRFALDRDYDVILEGILNARRYGVLLEGLAQDVADHHFFYLDVSFEETLRRHATKPGANEFGAREMRGWFRERDLIGLPGETVIPEKSSLEDAALRIVRGSSLITTGAGTPV